MNHQDIKSDKFTDKGIDGRFIHFYKNLPPKQNTLIRLFERGNGDYYCVYGDDALFVSDKFYKTSTVLKYAKNQLPMCNLSLLNTTSLLKMLLLVNLYSVEIWAADGRNSSEWCVIKKATPTHLRDVEELLFSSDELRSSVVLVVSLEVSSSGDGVEVGVAYTDTISSMLILISEFVDHNSLTSLEADVKECIVQDSLSDAIAKRISQLCLRCNTKLTTVPRAHFNTSNLEQDFNRLLDIEFNIAASNMYMMSRAMSAVACLINFFDLTSYEENYKKYSVSYSKIQSFMRLDASAVNALSMFDNKKTNMSSSLFSILNCCKTPQGSRLLAQWLKQPLMDIPELEMRYDITEAFYSDPISRQILKDQVLKKLPDFYRFVKLFSRKKQNLQDIVRLYQVIKVLPELAKTLAGIESCYKDIIKREFLDKLDKSIETLTSLCSMVESTVDLQAAENHEFLIKPDFDPRLKELRAEVKQLQSKIESEAIAIANRLGVEYEKKLKLENSSQYGYCLRLNRKDAASIRGNKEYVEYTTKKDGVYFTTSKISSLSVRFRDLSSQYDDLQRNIVKEVFVVAASYSPVFVSVNSLIAQIDVFSSFAHASVHASIPYVRPKLHPKGSGIIRLKAARHPCVEVSTNSFVTNDVNISKDSGTFMVITGPNMGGKSTYIRMVGVICLMAQIGCYVPAQEASVSIFDSIMTRIGAWDSQLKSVSTFMVEMLETSSIIKLATPASLIIIDELGRGTSTYDGFGLAYAISEYIITEIGAPTLFATHYHELTKLSERYPSANNYHAKAINDQNEVILLYKILPGPCDRSFGINAAVLAGFPEFVIKLAKIKAAELETFSENTISLPPMNDLQIEELTIFVETLLSEITECSKEASNENTLESKLVDIRTKYLDIAQKNPFLWNILSTV